MLHSLAWISAFAWLIPADAGLEAILGRGTDWDPSRFTFVRVEYDSEGGYGEAYYDYDGRFWHRWETDYPEAEQNLLIRMGQLSTIALNPEPIALRLDNDAIFRFPLIYMCDVGWMRLSSRETENLRAYLDRGGFLWVDDFWGDAEWRNFEFVMSNVYPDRQWQTIPPDHPVFNMVFPIEACPQVPARIFYVQGWLHDPPWPHRQPAGDIAGVETVNFRGLFDDAGRLVVAATHNTDLGDGWEREAEDSEYFERFSVKSYAMAINLIVYALTH